ncbi:metallophosphoesterase [Kribbella monticola]|uniref:metallophosphoesterase n=1 Tax=Kribbella monticola TaxID=2185285 RepID=UPI000DD3355B|nr:metallophosphoesterase [Kribbella monticola]
MTPATYAVSDVHGHVAELRSVLSATGLTDAAGQWTGGRSTLWFLGDYIDRGPSGLAVIDLVIGLQAGAAAAGGRVGALLGNHEVQFLAAHRFGSEPVPALAPYSDWHSGWRAFGGRQTDLDGLQRHHLDWLTGLPALARHNEVLLMHSDTDRYLEFGATIDVVNIETARVLRSADVDDWVRLCDVLSSRRAFLNGKLDRVLTTYEVDQVVHGHSTLTKHFGLRSPSRPYRYADRRATAIDGGVFDGGALLLATL